MPTFIKIGLLFLLGLIILSLSPLSQAQLDGNTNILINPLCPPNNQDCDRSNAEGLLHAIVNWLITIGTPIAVGMVLFGAYQMIFAGGDPEKFSAGKKTILYTVIGYVIILIGWGMTSIIRNFLSP